MQGELPTSEFSPIEELSHSQRYQKARERYWESRGITELEYYEEVIDLLETATGELSGWQRFYVIAAVSGRGVEWAQTRKRPHYHIVGLPCAICGRS